MQDDIIMIVCLFYSFHGHLDRLKLTAVYWLFETGIHRVYNIIEQVKHAKYIRLVRLLEYY